MRLKVSLGCGTIFGLHAGGCRGRFEYCIAGNPLEQVTEAEHQAEPGLVVVSPQVHKILLSSSAASVFTGTPLENGVCSISTAPGSKMSKFGNRADEQDEDLATHTTSMNEARRYAASCLRPFPYTLHASPWTHSTAGIGTRIRISQTDWSDTFNVRARSHSHMG